MEAVADLPEWAEVQELNPSNRDRFLAQDPAEFIATMERWMLAYCPRDDEPVPGLPEADARALDIPALVFRSGESDPHHTRATSEALAEILPKPAWSSRRGATASGSSARRPGRKGCSPAGRCWPRNCWSGRPTFWADRPISATLASGGLSSVARRPFSSRWSRPSCSWGFLAAAST